MNIPQKVFFCGALALAAFPNLPVGADVSLPRFFSDHMVLQRGEPVAV